MHAKDPQGSPADPGLDRGHGDPGPPGGTNPTEALTLGAQPSELWEDKLLFMPPSLWHLVTAAIRTVIQCAALIWHLRRPQPEFTLPVVLENLELSI